MTAMESYVYSPLPSGDFIRLLILKPGTDGEVLKGTLHITPLDEVQVFEAISYVWGSPDKACTILCNERTIRITVNLRDTLQQVRLPNERRILWADSICINQSDSKEKGGQVGLMWKIYSMAETVLVCVRVEECGNGPHVVSLLAEINAMIEDTFTKISLSPNTFPFPDEDDPLFFDERWKSVTALIRCPWFQRGWVIQEAGLAERAQMLWGAVKIDWDMFLKTLFWLTYRAPSLVHKFDLYMSPLHLESMAKRNKRVIQTMRGRTGDGSPFIEFGEGFKTNRQERPSVCICCLRGTSFAATSPFHTRLRQTIPRYLSGFRTRILDFL